MTGVRRHVQAGILCALITCVALGFFLTGFKISGAIVASGEVRTTITRQPIQHPSGGKVVHAYVTDGQKVVAGQKLLHLARPEIDAEIARLSRRDMIMKIEIARLTAERDGKADLALSAELLDKIAADGELLQVLATHRGLLAERRALERALDDSMAASLAQLDAEIIGLAAQFSATARQADLIEGQRKLQEGLVTQGLARAADLADLERDKAATQSRLAQLQTQQAQSAQRRAALRVEHLAARTSARETAITALAQLRRDHLALVDRLAELWLEQDATILRAPFDGWISDAIALSDGALLGAGQTAFVVIPKDQNLIIQARITPRFARQIKPDHPVWFQLAGSGGQSQAALDGRLLHLSADAIYDTHGAEPHFLATITTPDHHPDLVPGTPAEVYFATPPRNVWTYLTDPLRQYFNRSLRET